MRTLRKLALLGLAVLALCAMAAASASATTVTSPAGTPYSGSIVGTNIGTNPTLTSSWGAIVCTGSTINGTTNSSGVGSISSATWTGCTQFGAACTTPGQASGTIVGNTYTWASTVSYAPVAGGRDGTMTTNNPKVTISCAGLTCGFHATSVTGNTWNDNNPNRPVSTNSHSQVQFSSALTPDATNPFGCPFSATWDGTYALTTGTGADVTISA